MKINLKLANPAEIETECLVVAVVDAAPAPDKSESSAAKGAPGMKKEPRPEVLCASDAVRKAADELIAAKEVTGRIFETVMLHRPSGIKAKRLLLVGGGKAKNF